MELTAVSISRWGSFVSASTATGAMRGASRTRLGTPGWPPDPRPAALITSVLAFVVGGLAATWVARPEAAPGAATRPGRSAAVVSLGLGSGLVLLVAAATATPPGDRIGTLVALAAFVLGMIATSPPARDRADRRECRAAGGAAATRPGRPVQDPAAAPTPAGLHGAAVAVVSP